MEHSGLIKSYKGCKEPLRLRHEQRIGMPVQTSPQWESHPAKVLPAPSLPEAGFSVCHHCQPHTCWILQAGVSGQTHRSQVCSMSTVRKEVPEGPCLEAQLAALPKAGWAAHCASNPRVSSHAADLLAHCINQGQLGVAASWWVAPIKWHSWHRLESFLNEVWQLLTFRDTKLASWRTLCLQHCH